jgi:hypothetical protein
MEWSDYAATGRTIGVADYYRLSQNLESIRALLSRARAALPWSSRHDRVLAECVESHTYDDVLAMLAVADALQEDDSLAPEVWRLVARHQCAGKLQGILNSLYLISESAHALRARLESLVADKAKRLAYGTCGRDAECATRRPRERAAGAPVLGQVLPSPP